MLLGGVFQATGNQSPVDGAGQGPLDERRPRALGARATACRSRFNPHFPINTLTLMRGATGLQMREPAPTSRATSTRSYRAMWVDAAEHRTTRPCWRRRWPQAGFDAGEFVGAGRRSGGQGPGSRPTTEEAVARGVFGAPTFFVGDEMFFGQDRLDFVREALLAAR